MGTLWTVWPLDQQMREYLDALEVGYPRDNSRFPTGGEIKNALARLDGYEVEVSDNGAHRIFQAHIAKRSPDEWTTLIVDKFSGDDAEQHLWFEKGHETLILRVLKLLTTSCGPLALMADTGGKPIVVSRQDDLTGDTP